MMRAKAMLFEKIFDTFSVSTSNTDIPTVLRFNRYSQLKCMFTSLTRSNSHRISFRNTKILIKSFCLNKQYKWDIYFFQISFLFVSQCVNKAEAYCDLFIWFRPGRSVFQTHTTNLRKSLSNV